MNGHKKDFIAIFIFILSFFIIYFLMTKGTYLYGSTLDWKQQHYLIPEYFRNLFYQTGEIFPDFAPHLGSGQNIYYFSYYGLLNPYILFSYLLPFIKMVDYIQFVCILIPITSTSIFYYYLKKHTTNRIAFMTSFLFLCAGPIIFHSHRHWMFINYMPFYMLALFGIDAYFEKNKCTLFLISCFFIIMTSYYYSVGSLISLFCYGIYFGYKRKSNTKKYVKFCLLFVISILSSSILLLPTLYTLLNGRGIASSLPVVNLFVPKRNLRFLLYGTYALGTTVISLISILHLFFTKKKENKIVAFLFLLISIFPLFNYVLNGTLYIDSKALIPFLPLILLTTSHFLEDLFSKKVTKKEVFIISAFILFFTNSKSVYFDLVIMLIFLIIYFYTKREILYLLLMSCFSLCICIKTNLNDTLTKKSLIENDNYYNMEEAIDFITEQEENLYRIHNAISPAITMNKIQNSFHFATTLYSSSFNKKYNTLFFDTLNNPIPHRNKSMTPASSNPISQLLMGEKYIISTSDFIYDTKKVYEKGNVKVYEREHVLPIGYATNRVVSSKDLLYPNTALALLGNIVKEEGEEFISLSKEELNYIDIKMEKIEVQEKGDHYEIRASKGAKVEIDLGESYQDKILFIRFKNNLNPNCGTKELEITINGTKNKLSCKTWKYHNQNFVFDYILENPNKLITFFQEGKYDLSDVEIYSISYDELYSLFEDVDPFLFDKERTVGDNIVGDITVSNDGYFLLSIPYDKGFKAYVDGEEIKVEEVNESYIGFQIEKGEHHIQIKYQAPYKKTSALLSSIGILVLIFMIVVEKRKRNV